MKYLLFLLIVLASCNDGGSDPEFVQKENKGDSVGLYNNPIDGSIGYYHSDVPREEMIKALMSVNGYDVFVPGDTSVMPYLIKKPSNQFTSGSGMRIAHIDTVISSFWGKGWPLDKISFPGEEKRDIHLINTKSIPTVKKRRRYIFSDGKNYADSVRLSAGLCKFYSITSEKDSGLKFVSPVYRLDTVNIPNAEIIIGITPVTAYKIHWSDSAWVILDSAATIKHLLGHLDIMHKAQIKDSIDYPYTVK